MTEHSKLFPFSGAHRWSGAACPGSVALCLDEPDVQTEEAAQGTAVHWVASVMLDAFKRRVDHDGVDEGKRLVGVACPENGVIVDEEMFDAAYAFYLLVTKMVDVKHKDALVVEFRVHAPSIDKDAWGTLDVAYYNPSHHTIHLWDLKYGHRRVRAYKNAQLVGYAQALCETWKMDVINPRLELAIFQPRAYDGLGPFDAWRTTLDDIRAEVNHLRAGCADYRAGSAKLKAGAWCRDCPARYKCPADLDKGAAAADLSYEPVPQYQSASGLAYELTVTEAALKHLEKRVIAMRAEAERRVRAGEVVPGYRLAETFGRDKWSAPPSEVIGILDLFGVDARKPVDVLTPTQVRTLLKKKGVDASVISPYHGKVPTGVALVEDDTSRIKNIFSQEISNG